MTAILKQLEQLKHLHCGSNPHSSAYQPNEAEQRRLIMKNGGDRLVSVVLKRESAKYVFNQKLKLEEELKRKQLELAATTSEEVQEVETFSVKTPVSAGKSRKLMRKLPARKGGKRYSVFRGNISGGMIISRGTRLTGCLQYNTNGDAVLQELQEQGLDQYKDAKKIFDFLAQSFDAGKICQFHPRRSVEEVDLSQFNTQVSLSSVTRLEDLNQIRKKNGIMLLFDPSINTYGETITLRIKYMKFIDLNTEEEVTKHYTFASHGNYFHMTLIKDNFRHNEDQSGRQTAPSGGVRIGTSQTNNNQQPQNNNQDTSSSVVAFSERHHSHNSIPGWNTRPPIFIPAPKCTLQIVDLPSYSQNASLTNQLTRLRLYAVSCAGARAGIRRITETLDAFMVQQTANITLPNGRSSLNHACLYGNIEAVHHLVSMGGNINHRSKHDQHLTPLHQAVVGRHVEVVQYLLHHGANQLLKDDKGNCPLHYACMVGDITISRILMDSPGGRRALLICNNHDLKVIDVCANYYLKVRVEGVMRKHRIFQKPRVSLMERST